MPLDTAGHDTTIKGGNTSADTLSSAYVVHVPLTVIINNLIPANGPVVIGVYKAENKFLDAMDQFRKYSFNAAGNRLVAQINDLEYGEFALALYQDLNNDGSINRNLIGIPTEPYAFSNNYKPVFQAPRFIDCKFTYNDRLDTVVIAMIRAK